MTVYDMGTVHPTFETVNGPAIATVSNVSFKHAPVGGISCISFAMFQMIGTSSWMGLDPDACYVDNVEVKGVPAGSVIIVR